MKLLYTIEELEKIEKLFLNHQDDYFQPRSKEEALNMVLELIRQLKSHEDQRYCFPEIYFGEKNEQEHKDG